MQIKKSQSDKNEYRYLELDNQLKVILVSDPKAAKSAAALAVKVGANDNPREQAGLTHFLEHMLFLGTTKYPDASEYRDYINQFGGSNNAYTASDLTNYFFDIQPEGYVGALDRFAQFFINPLFDEQYTQREKNAVHSEYMAKIHNDARRSNQAFKTLFNPEHPANHFSVGNLDTLKDLPNLSLRQQLKNIYEQFYYAGNMALVMVANLPLAEMEQLARAKFSAIKSKNVGKARPSPSPLLLENTPRMQFVKPIKDIHTLNLHFVIPSQVAQYKSKPTRYISYLLGQEANNSLYSFLKQKGWITSLSAGLGSEYLEQQMFNVQLTLTKEGLSQIDHVINAVFFNIEQIKNQPINPAYIEEEKTLSQLAFAYHGYIHPLELSQTLVSQIHKYPAEDVLDAFRITQSANSIEVQSVLQYINTDNLLIQIVSKDNHPEHWSNKQPDWLQEKWYDTTYSNLDIKPSFLQALQKPNNVTEITSPSENPYIAEDLSFVSEFDPVPKSIFQGKGIQFWHRADNRFDQPKSSIYLAINFDNATTTVRDSLLNKLWARTINDDLREDTYLPYNANLNYSLYDTINGINVKTAGYTDKQQKYLLWLIEQVLTREPKKQQFEQTKAKLIKDLKNTKHVQPYSTILWAFSHKLTKGSHSIDAMLDNIDEIEYEHLLCFRNQAIQEFSFTGFSNGNKTHLSSHELAAELADIYEANLINLNHKQLERHTLISGSKYQHSISTTGDDKTVLYVISDIDQKQTGVTTQEDGFSRRALFTLLKQAIGANFFTKLRTEKQLGYIVNTYNLTRVNIPALGFLVQSPDHSITKITQEIEDFIIDDLTRITQLTDVEFHAIRTTVLQQLKQEEKTLGEDNYRFWKEIIKNSEDFYRKQKAITAIEKLTKTEFIHFIQQDILSKHLPRILLHNKAQNLPLWQDTLPEQEDTTQNHIKENDC